MHSVRNNLLPVLRLCSSTTAKHGGDNSWGALPHDQYRLLTKQYSYSYTMRLVSNEKPQP